MIERVLKGDDFHPEWLALNWVGQSDRKLVLGALPLGGAVAHGRVGQQAADASADLDDFLGGVNRTVLDVEAVRNAALGS